MNLPGFILDQATAAERVARNRLTYEAWGHKLTLDQYLDRERLLRQTEYGRLSMITWVLRVQNGVVMASCETFRLPLLSGGAMEVIASVFVDRPLRGAKMASRMLQALVENRREAGLDGMVLFSEVGAKIYADLGFSVLRDPARRWPAAAGEVAAGVELIPYEELQGAIDRRNDARADHIDLRMTDHLFDWHYARSRLYADCLNRPLTNVVGARFGDAQALWVPDFPKGRLRILDLTGPSGAPLEPIMLAATSEAASMGLASVDLWDDSVSEQLPGGDSISRDDDIPMGIAFTPRGSLFLGPLSRATWA